jgi:glycosyltransferase involved in cell wall biosynthesis
MNMRQETVVLDGRVFGTEAADRGMGRYVEHLSTAFASAGYEVVMLLLAATDMRGVRLPVHGRTRIISSPDGDPLRFTVSLNRLLVEERAVAYVDATPFLAPTRYDIYACPVIGVIFDLIPMRYPADYLHGDPKGSLDPYVNAIARLKKADALIAISHVVSRHAQTYLGIPKRKIDVLQPRARAHYERRAARAAEPVRANGAVTCIQGAHRSKNFPRAIPFLEQLGRRAKARIEIIVPTPEQRARIDLARSDPKADIRVSAGLSEENKFALQSHSRVIAHLSLEEGYGIPLLEALLLHKPIICVDNEINRELLRIGPREAAPAGVLLLDDPTLESDRALDLAARFVSAPDAKQLHERRAALIRSLLDLSAAAPAVAAHAIEIARRSHDGWHEKLGISVAAPAEFGSCGVSDYSHALTREGTANRYVLLLGPAPNELQLLPQARLLPIELLSEVRPMLRGVLFNLAVSDSLLRAFDAIATLSDPSDVLVVHDAGSYLPGILMDAAEHGNHHRVFSRYLKDESSDVRTLATEWLSAPPSDQAVAERVFLELDSKFLSAWLRAFRGQLISHHPAFDSISAEDPAGILAQTHQESEIRARTRYLPMPIDDRANPGSVRFSDKIRWALAIDRYDVLVCSAGSIVRGKHLPALARAICRINRERLDADGVGRVVLLLAGRVLEANVMAEIRSSFNVDDLRDCLFQVYETDETRFDAMLLASDIIVAFREQRRIQMSHAFARALALGRTIVTNEGSGFGDSKGVTICRDSALEEDLVAQLRELVGSVSARRALSFGARQRYRQGHSVLSFFERLRSGHD